MQECINGFPGGVMVKTVSQCRKQEDADFIAGSRRSPGAGNGKPF